MIKLNTFFRKYLTPTWIYRSQGMIWRLLMSETGRFVGECRTQERKQTSLFCLDEATGEVLWEGLQLKESWWLGLEAVQKNVFLIHGFVKPDLPQHYGIEAFAVETGKSLWSHKDLTYWFGVQEVVYAFNDLVEKRIAVRIDLKTGKILQTIDSNDELRLAREQSMEESLLPASRFPEPALESECSPEAWIVIQHVIKGKGIIGNPEYIQEQGYLLMNFYSGVVQSPIQVPSLDNHFCIVDVENRKVVFETTLSRNTSSPVPDAFFLKSSTVYFIKNGSELQALRLWK